MEPSYGVLLLAKIYLLLVMLLMGAGNWLVVRRLNTDPQPLLAQLRRFAEAEVGLGFTAILAAASMSAQPPAVDVPDQVSLQVIAARMHPEVPRMTSPAASQLTPPTSIETAVRETEFQANGGSDATDRKWSEYNHHWAGLIVLAAGLLAFASRFRRHALGALLAAFLRRSIGFHSAARRPRKLALGSASLLGQLFCPRRIAASRRRLAHPVLCGIRVRGAGGQITRPMGGHDFSRDVCVGRCGSAHP